GASAFSRTRPNSAEPHAAGPQQTDQADGDQVDRNDVVEQARHRQNEDAGNQRNQRRQTELQVHCETPVARRTMAPSTIFTRAPTSRTGSTAWSKCWVLPSSIRTLTR